MKEEKYKKKKGEKKRTVSEWVGGGGSKGWNSYQGKFARYSTIKFIQWILFNILFWWWKSFCVGKEHDFYYYNDIDAENEI